MCPQIFLAVPSKNKQYIEHTFDRKKNKKHEKKKIQNHENKSEPKKWTNSFSWIKEYLCDGDFCFVRMCARITLFFFDHLENIQFHGDSFLLPTIYEEEKKKHLVRNRPVDDRIT